MPARLIGAAALVAGLATTAVTGVASAGTTTAARTGAWQVSDFTECGHSFCTLEEVAAPNHREAWVVGLSEPGDGSDDEGSGGTVRRYDGRRWRTFAVPDRAWVHGVSTPSPRDVWVAGEVWNGSRVTGLAMHWDGRKLTRVAAPTADVHIGLRDISAHRDGTGYAVGRRDFDWGVMWRRTGSGWTRVTGLPLPTAPEVRLDEVVVRSATDVWALGQARYSEDRSRYFLLHYDGTRWSRIEPDGIDQNTWASALVVDGDRVTVAGTRTCPEEPTVPCEYGEFVQVGSAAGPWRTLPRLTAAGGGFDAATSDGRGGMWLSASGTGAMFAHWDGARWTTVAGPEGVRGRVTSLARAPRSHRLWAAVDSSDTYVLRLH